MERAKAGDGAIVRTQWSGWTGQEHQLCAQREEDESCKCYAGNVFRL